VFKLETENLLLRDFLYEDLPAYRALRSDWKFQRFYSEEDSSDQKSGHLLKMFIEQATAEPRTKYQLAVVTKTGELIGSCGVRIEAPGELSIGCELGRQWHGSGFAREAGKAMLAFGFQELDATRICAETVSDNKAAIRLCRSIGMAVREERADDRWFKGRSWGTTTLAIERSDWLRVQATA
jgi:ribosomal-protein-alanine N-acetyltransferase